jgi:ketosteroid isomerase-like protein
MPTDAHAFARQWEQDWNRRDLDAIMSHYRDDVVFRSRRAVAIAGGGEVRGKQALRAYWKAAIERQPDLKFSVLNIFEGHDMLVILYVNQHGVGAVETLYFDADGLVYQAAACHLAAPASSDNPTPAP